MNKPNVEILTPRDTWKESAHSEFATMTKTSHTSAPIQVDETIMWRYYSYNCMLYRVRK